MELAFLRPLVSDPGPWASVYLDATRAAEQGDREVELRWRALRDQLTDQGAPEATVAALETALREQPHQAGRYGLAMFARGEQVALVEPLADPPGAEEASYGPLPHTMPLVRQRGWRVPYVQVLADRTGADLAALCVGGAVREKTVTGTEEWPLRKVNAGGWSHSRYQQAAEESWRRNAGDVVAAATDLADTVGAEALVVGGDVRAVQQVVDQLPARWRDRTVRTELGSRGPNSDPQSLTAVTESAVTEVAQRYTREVVDRYQAQRAGEPAGPGLAGVVETLRRGQVETVLMVDDPTASGRLWVDPGDPTALALDPQTLRDSGVPEPAEVRADAALLRAAAGTGTGLVLVDAEQVELTDGIGALLRYTDASTPAT
jgi:hypothetical protein